MISVLKKRVAKPKREMSDEEFSSFKETLALARYQIKKSRLSQLYFDYIKSFDRAIES